MGKKIRKAVSLIFHYKSKVFIFKRQNYLTYFPGYMAFPGGKVEQGESMGEAAEREAFEELGVSIETLVSEGVIIRTLKVAHATTPEFNPYQFETTFFYYKCKKKPDFKVDTNEAAWAQWTEPHRIIRKYNAGECLLVNPIKVLLTLLDENNISESFIEFDQVQVDKLPLIEPLKDIVQIMPQSNTLPPASRTNCFALGDITKVLVDPSPKDIKEYRKLLAKLKEFQVDKICLTHHHADHHQFAPELAKYLGVPVYISKDSHLRIKRAHGENYFEGIEVVEIVEGDFIGRWMGQRIIAFEIPGHDEGHIGLAPEKFNWFIVGDLFQGIGTVVLGGDEGNMGKYFSSLEKVIGLKPACVIPSHGIALGGTFILEKTLKHRQERERQVLELYQQDADVDKIVKTLYFDIPRPLLVYARANIVSHLNKLKEEGRLD